MKISDELLEYVAEKYIELGLHGTKITFIQYLTSWLKANNYKEVA
jgi:hypothetical protein